MKIFAINNYNYGNLNFGSKKNKDIQKPVHSANPIKAIPVALLIAMSPINTPKASAQISQVQLEQIQNSEDEVVEEYICIEATPAGKPGKIKIHTDKNGKKYIKLNLFKETNTFANDTNGEIINAIQTSKINIRPEKLVIKTTNYSGRDTSSKETKYYVIGSGIQYITHIKDAQTGKLVKKSYHNDTWDVESQMFEITEEFYDLISNNPYDKIPTSKENSIVFTTGKR